MTGPADLSDADLVDAVAREVFGAEHVVHLENGWVEWWMGDRVPRLRLDWHGIGRVVEAMRREGWSLSMSEHEGPMPRPLTITFRRPSDRGMVRGRASDEDPARAVMDAALAAVRSVET